MLHVPSDIDRSKHKLASQFTNRPVVVTSTNTLHRILFASGTRVVVEHGLLREIFQGFQESAVDSKHLFQVCLLHTMGQFKRGCAHQDRICFMFVCKLMICHREIKTRSNFTFGHATEKLIVGYRGTYSVRQRKRYDTLKLLLYWIDLVN